MLLKYGIKYSDLFSTETRSALDVKAGLLKGTESWLKKVEAREIFDEIISMSRVGITASRYNNHAPHGPRVTNSILFLSLMHLIPKLLGALTFTATRQAPMNLIYRGNGLAATFHEFRGELKGALI